MGGAIAAGIASLKSGTPIVTDVTMVTIGVRNLVAKTFNNPIITPSFMVAGLLSRSCKADLRNRSIF